MSHSIEGSKKDIVVKRDDCYPFDSWVDVEEVVFVAAGEIILNDDIDNPEIFLSRDPEQAVGACHQAIESGVQIRSSGCAIPLTAPIEILKTFVKAAEGSS